MANTILTPTAVTRRALLILHQKLNFISNIDRQYDSSFAQAGAKIGQALLVRLPNKYVGRTGAVMSVQNTVERSVNLPLATQKGVDVNFSSAELAMSIDDFAQRILDPAMAQLAALIEADAYNMYKDVPNYAGSVSGQITYKSFQQAGQYMDEKLAPPSPRNAILNPVSRVEFNDAVKGLYQDSQNIANQYVEGVIGRTGGYDVLTSTLVPAHTPGTYGGSPIINGTLQGNAGTGNAYVATSSIITNGWTATSTVLKAGDIITIGGLFDVHPETKASIGRLKRFVVTADTVTDGSGNSTFTIAPGIIAGGAYQNVVRLATTNDIITVLGTSATAYQQSLMFYRDAFAFVSADLDDVSKYGAWGARVVQDGISMRVGRQWDVINDNVPTRFDVLYGYATLRPELAVRHVNLVA